MNEEEVKKLIAESVNALLRRKLKYYAAIFGAANVIAFLGFAITVWQTTTSTARTAAESFAQHELQRFDLITGQAEKRLDKLNSDFDSLNKEAGAASANLRTLSDRGEKLSTELADLNKRSTDMSARFSQLAELQPAKLAAAMQQIGDAAKVNLLETFGALTMRVEAIERLKSEFETYKTTASQYALIEERYKPNITPTQEAGLAKNKQWNTRKLTSISKQVGNFATLNNEDSSFTLDKGAYMILGFCRTDNTIVNQIALFADDPKQPVLLGSSGWTNGGGEAEMWLVGRIECKVVTKLRLMHYINAKGPPDEWAFGVGGHKGQYPLDKEVIVSSLWIQRLE